MKDSRKKDENLSLNFNEKFQIILTVKSRDGQIRTGDPLSPRQVL